MTFHSIVINVFPPAAVEETDWGGVPLLHTTAYRDVTQTESDATALEEIQQ